MFYWFHPHLLAAQRTIHRPSVRRWGLRPSLSGLVEGAGGAETKLWLKQPEMVEPKLRVPQNGWFIMENPVINR